MTRARRAVAFYLVICVGWLAMAIEPGAASIALFVLVQTHIARQGVPNVNR